MKSNEWLSVMQQAEDYNPQLTPLIIKYGELLLSEHPVSQPVAELPKEAEGKETFDNLSTADKIKCVQGSKELLDAVKILRAAFDGCGLQSYIRFTYTFQDDKRFEITFMPNQHHEDYSNPLISKNQTD